MEKKVGNKNGFERITTFSMPFDKRHEDPKKNYGIGSLRIRFILKKDKQAVNVVVSTNCYLQKTIKEYIASGKEELFNITPTLDAWTLSYHDHKKHYESQELTDCDVLDSGECYSDSSFTRASSDKVAEGFLEEGESFVWTYLEKYFEELFGEKNEDEN